MASPQNDFYGHRRLLNDYVGAAPSNRFLGIVQHGWDIGGWTPPTARLHIRRFGWSERAGSGERLHLIGAPFLYHPSVRRQGPPPAADHVLVLPYHGFGTDIDGAHREYARFLEKHSGFAGITVCLHPLEYDSPVRQIYTSHGYDVVTNGDRTDPAFLDRLVALLRRHALMTTNRVSTAVFYAGAMRRAVVIEGPFPRSVDRVMSGVAYDEQIKQQRIEFPELFDGLTGDEANSLAARELGMRHVREPDELAALLWARWPRQALPVALDGINQIRKRVRRPSPVGPPSAAAAIDGETIESLTTTSASFSPERSDTPPGTRSS
jgi:hypothetical protein